ncbi:MAG: hypothetical protein E6R04_05790 [Spirochaetes bacterium]|nr:MAG: hypothetical protein E6R04_05790 [Spirochaetota bacterium]
MRTDEVDLIKPGCLLRIRDGGKYKYPITPVVQAEGNTQFPTDLTDGDAFVVLGVDQVRKVHDYIWLMVMMLASSGDKCWISFMAENVELVEQER